MGKKTVRDLAERLVGLGMVPTEKAAEVLAGIAAVAAGRLDEELTRRDLIARLPDFGPAVPVHAEDVDDVAEYYPRLLAQVSACTGGAVAFSGAELVRIAEDEEYLHFLRDGEPVWWYVEHPFGSYPDQAAVAAQFSDLDPGGDDPRTFHLIERDGPGSCQDDVYVLATPEQARALRTDWGLEFAGPDVLGPDGGRPRRGEPPTAEPGTALWYVQDDRRYLSGPARTAFDRWSAGMAGALAAWRARFLPADFPLDFDAGSLDALARLVGERFTGPAAFRAAAAGGDPFATGAVRCLGETLIRVGPAHWTARTVDDDSPYGRLPTVRANAPLAFLGDVCLVHELSRATEDRTPGLLAAPVAELREAVGRYRDARQALAASRAAARD